MLPDELCSDHDLAAIADTSPRSAEELAAITAFGPLTAARLFAPIRAALDGAADVGTDSLESSDH
jgi:hypothetical protein